MALTTAQQVRLRIQDIPAVADVTRTFDGSASAYPLDHLNAISGTAFVSVTGAWTATVATFSQSGFVTFSGIGSANSAYRTRYVYSVFSDNEIGHFTAVGGGVAGAALEAVNSLMFDGLKRAKWAAPDGSMYDDTTVLDKLWDMHSVLSEEKMQSETVAQGFESWAEGQELW